MSWIVRSKGCTRGDNDAGDHRISQIPWVASFFPHRHQIGSLLRGQDVELRDSWVIGDSIRSDILPARKAGLNAIYLRTPNWSVEHEELPPGVPTVARLSEVVSILM